MAIGVTEGGVRLTGPVTTTAIRIRLQNGLAPCEHAAGW